VEHEKRRRRTHIGYWWGKRPLGRPRRRWVDNIRMDLGESKENNVFKRPRCGEENDINMYIVSQGSRV
jgi:hypothetical protein